jgi:hypothetical protein
MVCVLMHPTILRPHGSMDHRYNSLPFQFKIQILTHSRVKLSYYRVLIRAHHSCCRGRVSHSRAAFDVATATASSWILAATAFRWILAAIASSRSSKPEFQHSSPTFRPGILAVATVSTSSLRASPTVGNASVDDTDAAAVATFFFATYSKPFVPTFNCSIRNTSKCRTQM